MSENKAGADYKVDYKDTKLRSNVWNNTAAGENHHEAFWGEQ